MKTNNRFKLTCYYVRGEFQVPVFETSSLQQLEILIRRKARGLLCFRYDCKLANQRDYLEIRVTRMRPSGFDVFDLCRYSLSEDGEELWAY